MVNGGNRLGKSMGIYQELKDRGFCYQETDAAAIEKLLTTESVRYYVGFDPTGNSLHVGHLLPVMAMRFLQKAGHVPIVLVGGATAQIGDPSGRITLRPIMTKETIAENAECLRRQLARFIRLENGEAYFVNNLDWFKDINYIDFLREVGSKFSVNRMLAQESVRARLENGLSFLEFNYSLLQAYDFLVLHDKLGAKLEFGGQDQWGNIVAGVELVRRMRGGAEVDGMTFPLLLDSNGQKFGKTAGGNNVWLDPERTPVFEYYQFWRNAEDAVVRKLLCYFSTLPVPEIHRLTAEGSNINRAKEILAYEATTLAHGADEAAKAYLAAGGRFGFADPEHKVETSSAINGVRESAATAELPSATVSRAAVESAEGLWICRAMVEAGFCNSTSDAKRLVLGGAVSLNEEKVADPARVLRVADFASGEALLRSGKKNFKRLLLA